MSDASGQAQPPGGQFLVYQTEDGKLKIDVRLEGETVWLTQQHMAELFQTTQQNISQWFQDTGWSYASGADLAPEGATPERADFRTVILKARLAAAVGRLNPKLPAAAVEEVVHLVATPTETSLPRNNRAFHRMLMDGVKVEFTNAQGEKETDHAQLVDFQNPANNDFLVVNQFTAIGEQAIFKKRRAA